MASGARTPEARPQLNSAGGLDLEHDVGHAGGYALLDIDDPTIEVHGHQKHGAGFGYSKVRGLNALLADRLTATALRIAGDILMRLFVLADMLLRRTA